MAGIAVMVAMEAELVHLRNLTTTSNHRRIALWDAFDLVV